LRIPAIPAVNVKKRSLTRFLIATISSAARSRSSRSDRCDRYRHCAARCVELARRIESPRDRLVLLEMVLVWSRILPMLFLPPPAPAIKFSQLPSRSIHQASWSCCHAVV
jgi:hypothetical protein